MKMSLCRLHSTLSPKNLTYMASQAPQALPRVPHNSIFHIHSFCSLIPCYFPRRKQTPLKTWETVSIRIRMLGEKACGLRCSPTQQWKPSPGLCARGVGWRWREKSNKTRVSETSAAAVTSSRAPGHSCTWLSVDSVDSSGLRRDEFGRPWSSSKLSTVVSLFLFPFFFLSTGVGPCSLLQGEIQN